MKRPIILGKVLLALILGLLCSTLLTGCKSEAVSWHKAKDPFAKKNAKKSAEPKIGTPERMVVIWKDAVYEHPALPPTRGIGGRVYFYDGEDNPIKVDGEVVVYGFNDTSGRNKAEADRKFVFKQESLASHYNATAIGPSYSIWLPWDKLGGQELSVSLIPVFRDQTGKVIRSGQTICVLPGPETEKRKEMASQPAEDAELIASFTAIPGVQKIPSAANLNPAEGLQPVVHLSETANGPEVNRNGTRIRSTTISLPSDTAMRLQQASRGLNLPASGGAGAAAPAAGGPSSLLGNATAQNAALGQSAIQGNVLPATGNAAQLGTPPTDAGPGKRDASRGVFGLPGALK